MGFYRIPSERSKFHLPKEEYLTAIHYALRYPYLIAELETVASADTGQAIQYDKPVVQTSGGYDPVSTIAIKREEIQDKIDKINGALEKVAPDEIERKYLMMGVCYGANYWQLDRQGIPFGKSRYYKMRKMFYFILAKII